MGYKIDLNATTLISRIRNSEDVITVLTKLGWDLIGLNWYSPVEVEKSIVRLDDNHVKIRKQLMFIYSKNYKKFLEIINKSKDSQTEIAKMCGERHKQWLTNLKNASHVVKNETLIKLLKK